MEKEMKYFVMASMICGILAVVSIPLNPAISFILGILALSFSIVYKRKFHGSPSPMVSTGLCCGAVAVGIFIFFFCIRLMLFTSIFGHHMDFDDLFDDYDEVFDIDLF